MEACENPKLINSARFFNTLMTEVFGYMTFAAHGNSNGALIILTIYDAYNTTRAAHFATFPFYPTAPEELVAQNITISPLEQFIQEQALEWTMNGTGYFLELIYKVSK